MPIRFRDEAGFLWEVVELESRRITPDDMPAAPEKQLYFLSRRGTRRMTAPPNWTGLAPRALARLCDDADVIG